MKVAFSGTHGTGKTTNALKLAHEIKMNYPQERVGIVQEVARTSPYPINKKQKDAGSLWMFSKQLNKELSYANYCTYVITDRTILDTVAYASYLHLDCTKYMFNFAKGYMKTYDKIYVKLMSNNDFNVEDGVRSMDAAFREEIENILVNMYSNLIVEKLIKKNVVEYI